MKAAEVSAAMSALPEIGALGVPEDWTWPPAPQTVHIYDKYSDVSTVLRLADENWMIPSKGDESTIRFAPGKVGLLQRRIVLLTQASATTGTLRRFAAVLVRDWDALRRLLVTPPHALRDVWEKYATTVHKTGAFKAVLKLACRGEVGHWTQRHAALVKSLDTLANEGVRRRTSALEGRQKVVGPAMQAAIVQVLDTVSTIDEMLELDVEGAAALALIFQHGVRPVQVLCLKVEHVQFFKDVRDDLTCIVSFHAAKQESGKEWEMVRQVKPEWAPLIARLHATAIAYGRRRLFSALGPSTLWNRARAACQRQGVRLTCSAVALRHSAAQSLADAGHSRASIQKFLGHTMDTTARAYIKASLHQAELINTALGASKLYGAILSIADSTFVSEEEIQGGFNRSSQHLNRGGVAWCEVQSRCIG
ncbi:site-specific integrase [Cupriavidus campinensis]